MLQDAPCSAHTHEIAAPWRRWAASAASVPMLNSLVPEYIRNFSAQHTYLIGRGGRRVPFEAGCSGPQLQWEFEETQSFVRKQLKADPRMKPRDIEVKFDHLLECTSCRQRQEALGATRSEPGVHIDLGSDWQLLVDDWLIHSWRNILRFLNPPDSQQVVMEPPASSTRKTRFGCPCSVIPPSDGHAEYRLYHTAGAVAGSGHRYPEWPQEYVFSSSPNGVDGWGAPRRLKLDGFSKGISGSFTASHEQGSHAQTHAFVAGYEGANSKVCVARSTDGFDWTTVRTSEKSVDVDKVKRLIRPKNEFVRAVHLTKKNVKINFLTGHYSAICRKDVQRCRRAGVEWGGGLMQACILDLGANKSLSSQCFIHLAQDKYLELLSVACLDGTPSALGRAGDCNVQPVFDARKGRQLVWYRRDFGTAGGWREIRGVQIVELDSILSNDSATAAKPAGRVSSYYLDRLGKLERFRRQIYSVTLTRHSKDLWLGLMTVIEWAKDMGEPVGDQLPSFQRDTTSVYLVTSRDGVHIDDEWVYARRPLLPKGKLQRDWNSGFQLAAAQLVTDYKSNQWRVYFEARKLRHEDRFKDPGVIGMAAWRLGALVGLRAADPTRNAAVVTKTFKVASPRLALLLNVDMGSAPCGESSVLVELLSEDLDLLPRAMARRAAPLIDTTGTSVRVSWKVGPGLPLAASTHVPAGIPLRLRFTLRGAVRLYAFRVLPNATD
jgi:hypothetical protein